MYLYILINEVPLFSAKTFMPWPALPAVSFNMIGYSVGLQAEVNAILSAIIVISIRTLAVKYHWQLPILKGEDHKGE